jgi:hypothetical protein
MSWGYDLLVDAHKSKFWSWATRYALKRSSVMVGDCQIVRQTAVSFGMPEDRIITFPWGVDLQHFSPGAEETQDPPQELRSRLGWRENAFILLSTRSWELIYGLMFWRKPLYYSQGIGAAFIDVRQWLFGSAVTPNIF